MANIKVLIDDKQVQVLFDPFASIINFKFSDTTIKIYPSSTEYGQRGYLARINSSHNGRQDIFNVNLDTLTRDCCLKVVNFAHYFYKNYSI